MPFPTPTIYQYRVLHTKDATNAFKAMYESQFSINGGVTWFSLYPFTFQDLNEALREIANVVSQEAQFRTKIQHRNATFTEVFPYPPIPNP